MNAGTLPMNFNGDDSDSHGLATSVSYASRSHVGVVVSAAEEGAGLWGAAAIDFGDTVWDARAFLWMRFEFLLGVC